MYFCTCKININLDIIWFWIKRLTNIFKCWNFYRSTILPKNSVKFFFINKLLYVQFILILKQFSFLLQNQSIDKSVKVNFVLSFGHTDIHADINDHRIALQLRLNKIRSVINLKIIKNSWIQSLMSLILKKSIYIDGDTFIL